MTNTSLLRSAAVAGAVDAVVDELVEIRRGMAALQAREAAVLARAVAVAQAQADVPGPSEVRDIPMRSMAAQLGAALRVSDRIVQRHLSDAVVLTERFPATWAALAAGEVSRAHVRVIVDAGQPIDDDRARAEYEAVVLEVARRETPGRLRPAARMLAARPPCPSLSDTPRPRKAGACGCGTWTTAWPN